MEWDYPNKVEEFSLLRTRKRSTGNTDDDTVHSPDCLSVS